MTESLTWLCSQALKVLRSAEYAPYVVFIAAPSARDLQLAKTTGIDVSLVKICGLVLSFDEMQEQKTVIFFSVFFFFLKLR